MCKLADIPESYPIFKEEIKEDNYEKLHKTNNDC
jgi:hypothetical protein